MPAAAVSLIGTAYAASSSASASKSASRTLAQGTADTLAQQEKFFNIAQENLAPYREMGTEAVDKMRSVFIEGNMDEFYESADYKFNLEQGEQALSRKQSAAGSQYGGAALKEALQYSQGVASNEYGNFFNRLNSMTQTGQAAAAGTASAAMQTGASTGQTIQSGAVNQANIGMQGAQSEYKDRLS